MNHYTQELKAGLKRMGIPYNVENGGTHNKLLLAVHGETVKYPIPKSPSDGRAVKNTLADIKRITGYTEPDGHYVKVSRSRTSGYQCGALRIGFTKAVMDKMFNGLPRGHANCRFDANFNATSRILLVTPHSSGRRNFTWQKRRETRKRAW